MSKNIDRNTSESVVEYAYPRVSTPHQKLERQIQNIQAAYPKAILFPEKYTGTKMDRPQWKKLYRQILADVDRGLKVRVIFDEASRLARNAEEGIKIYEELFSLGVELIFLKTPHINTETYKSALRNQLEISTLDDAATNELVQGIAGAINRYILALARQQIFLAFQSAEDEINYLHQRVSEGVRLAALEGKQIGSVKGSKKTTKKSVEMKKLIQEKSKYFNGSINDQDLIKITGLSANTFYKYKRELLAEISGADE
jgi:DNA invertase Pin-like site-specific DNA recombinase